MATRKLALILSGAVSLGSFEAGVLTELLYALDHLARLGDPKFELDVITGASAGSMTAALVARSVLHDFGLRRRLFEAWVNDIDIRNLLEGAPDNALLSKDPIEKIADRCFTGPFAATAPASFAPETLHMAFTLSNVNGLDAKLRYRLGDAFVATFFADGAEFHLGPREAVDPGVWQSIRQCAIASGNFPIAFVPALVNRIQTDFAGYTFDPRFPGKFTYVDGGLFNNEPIGRAVELAWGADGEELDRTRKFLLVDANLNKTRVAAEFDDKQSLLAIALRLVNMLNGEASALDWLQAQRRNTEIEWRDLLLEQLLEMIATNDLADPDRLVAQLDAVANRIVDQKRALLGDDRYPPSYLATALERTARRYHDQIGALSDVRRKILVRVIFVLNSIAGLDRKSVLDIDIIFASKEQTAGDQLSAFGGFFKREWREYDYRLGRIAAHERLPKILDVPQYPQEAGAEREYLIPVEWAGFANVKLAEADRAPREAFRDAVATRIRAIADGGGKPSWFHPVDRAKGNFIEKFVKSKLNELLDL
ncbi:MAG TPA: DUF3376 domain-containing protein [Candidatus Binatia bacterium]|nr:DUF3376 domain-containing protein [Candidatus Binatia bacterium]